MSVPDFWCLTQAVELVAQAVDGIGVAVVVLGLLIASCRYLAKPGGSAAYRRFRREIGRGILPGLEFLVAADIVRTVAVPPTPDGVLVLGFTVLIRTFLSMSPEVELEGRWPWQTKDAAQSRAAPHSADRP